MNVFDEMGGYWAAIADKNQTERQHSFLKSKLPRDSIVLDLACGTGRHAAGLGKSGFDVVGIDISLKLLQIAKQNVGNNVSLVRADLRHLPFKPQTFGAVISMDTSLGYLESEAQDAKCLSEAHRVLRCRGLLVVDVFNRAQLVARYLGKEPTAKGIDYPEFMLIQTRAVSERGDLLCDKWTIHDKLSGQEKIFKHRVRLYLPSRLQHLLETAGFDVRDTLGDYESQEYSDKSSRLIFLSAANQSQLGFF